MSDCGSGVLAEEGARPVEDQQLHAVIPPVIGSHGYAPIPKRFHHAPVRQRDDRSEHVPAVSRLAQPQLMEAAQLAS